MKTPAIITAGDAVTWRQPPFSLANGTFVSPPAWSLKLHIRGPLAAGLDLDAGVDGADWTFAISAVQSAAFNAGPATALWYWQLRATLAGQPSTAARGVLKVRPNLGVIGTGAVFDGRSDAEKILAAIELEIKARIDGGATLEYTIGQRSLKKEPMTALLELRDKYRAIVRLERRKGRISDIQTVQVQFSRR